MSAVLTPPHGDSLFGMTLKCTLGYFYLKESRTLTVKLNLNLETLSVCLMKSCREYTLLNRSLGRQNKVLKMITYHDLSGSKGSAKRK